MERLTNPKAINTNLFNPTNHKQRTTYIHNPRLSLRDIPRERNLQRAIPAHLPLFGIDVVPLGDFGARIGEAFDAIDAGKVVREVPVWVA